MKLALLVLVVIVVEPLDAERPALSPVTLTFAIYSSTPDMIDVTSTSKTRIDAVWVGFQDARLRPISACKGGAPKALVAGPFTVELVKRYVTTIETRLEIARYCAFDVHLWRTKGGTTGAPSELRGASIVVEGRRSDGVQFTVRSRLDAALTLRAADLEGFAISEGGARWIAGVDVARWFENIELLEAPAEGPRGRMLVIDERSNPELLARFNLNVEHGLALFDDRNGDRHLDAEERARPIALRR